MFITQNLKSWEYALFKGAKVLGWVVLSAVVAYLVNVLSNYHPVSGLAVMEVGVINTLLVSLQNWITAHQAIKESQQKKMNQVATPSRVSPEELPANAQG